MRRTPARSARCSPAPLRAFAANVPVEEGIGIIEDASVVFEDAEGLLDDGRSLLEQAEDLLGEILP